MIHLLEESVSKEFISTSGPFSRASELLGISETTLRLKYQEFAETRKLPQPCCRPRGFAVRKRKSRLSSTDYAAIRREVHRLKMEVKRGVELSDIGRFLESLHRTVSKARLFRFMKKMGFIFGK